MTGLNIVEDAFVGLNVCQPNELDPGDATIGLGLMNRILDNWNAEQRALYASTFASFTLTPLLSPHTIGLVANAPTFAVTTTRPVRVDGACLVIGTGTSAYRVPITADRDRAWWLGQTLPAMTSIYPTDLYYEPTWPNGSLYFWPVPSVAYTVELLLRVVLAQLTLAATFSLPPGYQDAITLTLEEALVGPYHVTDTTLIARLEKDARKARARIFDDNVQSVPVATADYGVPSLAPGGGWDWRTGMNR